MALTAPPLLGVLGSVCEVTAQVADREVLRQAQVAPDYERLILQALSNDAISGPHWMPCLDREPLKCSVSTRSISGIMQTFLAMDRHDERSSPRRHKVAVPAAKKAAPVSSQGIAAIPTRIPPPKASPVKRPCWQESSVKPCPGPAAVSRSSVVQASPAKRACWQESSPVADNPSPSPGPAAVSRSSVVQASPAKRACWQESSPVAENPGPSPGVSASEAASSKEPAKRLQDDASPIARIAQAPSPIRAVLHFGPAKGEVEDAPVLPGAPEDPKAAAVKSTAAEKPAERPAAALRAPAAPAAFAQDTIIEPTEEVHVPRPGEWHSKALFEQPPDSPLRKAHAPARPRHAGKPPLAELPQVSPERKELTPLKVADRIMMFEKIISPSVRCMANGVAMSSSARLGKAVGSANRGSATCSNDRSSGRAVDGSSLFTPVQPAWARPDVKPKELFRSNSDLALKPRFVKPEVPKPKAKVAPRKPPGHHHATSSVARADKENANDVREALDRQAQPQVAAQRREALKPRLREAQVPQEGQVLELKRATPVPMFKDPALDMRAMILPPKNPEENYAISEYGGDSEGDDAAEREKIRQKKPVPKWCEGYISSVQNQQAIDPDSIFGRVPRCVMDDVFPESLYQQVGKKRPARRRGSSGDWKRDRLTRNEIRSYKQRMGQKRSWDEPNMLPPA